MLTVKPQAVASVSDTPELPNFTEVIKIEVEVQDVFVKLLGLFPEDLKHRELIAHAMVGSAANKGNLGYLYNAMNGYTQDVNYHVGNMIECNEHKKIQWYDANLEDEDGKTVAPASELAIKAAEDGYKPNWKTREIAIGTCKVVEINLYSDKKLRVEFMGGPQYRYGADTMNTEWVNHKNCQKWANPAV